jgi:WD40 repeat protein
VKRYFYGGLHKLALGIVVLVLSVHLNLCANEIGKPFLQLGHSKQIFSIALSPDGQILASGSRDNSIRLWDFRNNREIKHLEHNCSIVAVAFTKDGQTLVSADEENNIYFWDIRSGNKLKRLSGHTDFILSIAFSPDGTLMATGSRDKTIRIWEVKTGKELKSLKGHQELVKVIVFSTDGRILASGSADKTIILWDVKSGKEIKRLLGHNGIITSIKFSRDSQTLHSGSRDETIRFWDIKSGKELNRYECITVKSDLIFSQDGHNVAALNDNRIVIYDAKNGTELNRINDYGFISTAIFLHDNKTLASSSGDSVSIWDLKTGKEIKRFTSQYTAVSSVAISEDGKLLTSSSGSNISVWNLGSNERQHKQLNTPKNYGRTAKFLADKGIIVSPRYDKTIRFFDIGSSEEIKKFEGHKDKVNDVVFSSDNEIMASAGWDKFVKLWNVKSGKQIKNLIGHTGTVWSLYFSPEGKTLISGSADKSIRMWDIQSGKELKNFIGHTDAIFSVSFSPDGRMIASGGADGSVRVWDVDSGKELNRLEGHSSDVNAIVFTSDNKILVSGSSDKTIRFWDVKSGKELKKLKQKGAVTSLASSKYSQTIISASSDGTVKLWDTESGKEILTMVSFSDGEWVSITPEGYFDASAGGAKHLNVLTGPLSVTSVDAYYETFYRPEIVAKVLKGEKVESAIRIADVKPAPSVEIINTPTTLTESKATITLRITDNGGGVGQIRLYRNGSSVLIDGERALKPIRSGDTKTFSIPLENGVNTIKTIAFNAQNTMQSEDALITITAKIATSKPTLHAVVIGVNEFKNPKISLSLAVSDANLFAKILKEKSYGLFGDVKVTLLTSKDQTTKSSIEQTLTNLRSINPNDLFVFYVASHGTVEDGKYYLITSNVGALSTRKLQEDAMTQDRLKELIGNIPSSKKLVLLDTCFSGAMGSELIDSVKTRGLSEDAAIKTLNRAVGGTIISASTNAQEALEGYKNQGLFTYVLSEALSGKADADQDGFIKTTELSNYIEDIVPELAEKAFNREQFPTVNTVGQGFPIVKTR